MDENVERGRESYRRHEWREAHHLLSLADEAAPLEVDDLERLATAAYLIGRGAEFHRLLDRAHQAHRDAGNPERAARCAFWLSLTSLLQGEIGQSSGWVARGRRIIEGRDCVEQGYLLLPLAEQQLHQGDQAAAGAAASEAAAIGSRFGDADLLACARHLEGRILLASGEVQAGLRLLDEAMVAAVAGELAPIVTGLIYCSVIDACQQVFALSRAREWTSALSQWCEGQPEMVAFTRTCLLHRAEILQFQGAWPDAMAEACRARERAPEGADAKPPASAWYRQAEIHRLRGELAEAEEAYRNASRSGREPQPGLALLRLAQGRTDAAAAAIRRVMAAASDPLHRAKLLPAHVEIMLASGDLAEAREACRELEQIAERYDADVLHALAATARGATELAEGRPREAVGPLRRAFDAWQRIDAPYEAARARVLIATACGALRDEEAAGLELDAARAAFEKLQAAPELARIDAIGRGGTDSRPHGLTPRELEVLRLVAAGKTNKAIAGELSLSERTIDRHVSNILSKLEVPSRAAATAWAYDHALL